MSTRATYGFSNSAPEAAIQLDALAHYLGPITTAGAREVGVASGWTCWDVGAGGGRVAQWLAEAVGPTGRVIASDIDTTHLRGSGSLEILEHNVTVDPPPGTDFDLIHASLLLLHLPERRTVLRQLVQCLKPGGWLLIEEFSSAPLRVLTAPSPADAELFGRVIEALLALLTQRGADLDWANQVHGVMAEAGLVELWTRTHAQSWIGGGPGALLHEVNSRQKQDELLASGLTMAELDRFRALMGDPNFAALSYQLVATRGRRPH